MGYADLAELMSSVPEVAIFRRFSVLNAKNLLYLQAELVQLEIELNMKIDLDKRKEREQGKLLENSISPDRDWQALSTGRSEGGGKTQWQMFKEIRAKLKEYNEALNMQVIASGFEKPRKHELKFLNEMLKYSDVDHSGLQGFDRRVWKYPVDPDDATALKALDDLIALKVPPKRDFLSNLFLSGSMLDKFLQIRRFFSVLSTKDNETHPASTFNGSFEHKYIRVEDEKLYRIANMITIVISSTLPIASVIILYFIDNMRVRLGVVAAFMAAFSLTLALVTEATRVEIFGTTAGFAAVLVVFVGSTSLSTSLDSGGS